jgi:pilus assembly protein Flp/PilA
MVRIHAEIGRIYAALKDRLEAEEGQAMVEYALILALVSIVAIAVLQAMGIQITALFGRVNSALTSVNT